jgi:hypothetical protein
MILEKVLYQIQWNWQWGFLGKRQPAVAFWMKVLLG